ncbi:DUF3667 domain-containing protein [Mucilaginibacter litoreus]|uniref:DUF3667 domain-containing protein n=1 Tax=Mucilaginibacter litoreus TaxID=1048221 RepID=A0ABW3ASA4_9SPHI
MKKHYRKENDCLNCGTILQGNFCHNCGQENLQMKESFGHMLNHAVSDYFHFDYQFFHTLKPLFFKPGHLTNEYNAGRRAQYLHPVKMYIFISLVFFVVAFGGSSHHKAEVELEHNPETIYKADSVKKAFVDSIKNSSNLSAAQKAAITDHVTVTTSEEKGKVKYNLDYNQNGSMDMLGVKLEHDKTYADYLKRQDSLPPMKKDNILERYIAKKAFDWQSQGKNAQEMFVEALKHNSPKVMFLLLPLFALILKIAFYKNHKYYVEHIIYAIHLHCFIFLFLIAILLLKLIIPHDWNKISDWLEFLAALTIIWYIYRSLRVVYNRSRWRTITKMLGVSFMYSIIFGLSVFVIVLITAITTV